MNDMTKICIGNQEDWNWKTIFGVLDLLRIRNFLLLDAPNNNYFFVFCSFIEIYLNGYLWFSYSSLNFNVSADYQSRLSSFMCVHISVLPFYLYSSGYSMFYSRQIYKVIDRYFLKWLKIMYVRWQFPL